jgi:SSS family solute:Na+ symporter
VGPLMLGEFTLHGLDYAAIIGYFGLLAAVGIWVGRKERTQPDEYFLAGRTLPWYVVGSSFVASNISTEHFIGMIGAAYVFGLVPAMSEWGNIWVFSLLIWFFIPFLLASRVFTVPEFLERRFNPTLRMFFAVVTIISNVVAFLAAVIYGGAVALQSLFGWPLWFGVLSIGLVGGGAAIYGGLKSVAWTDFLTIIIMILGGLAVTILGLQYLAGGSNSIVDGFRVMIERNQGTVEPWAQAAVQHAQRMAGTADYNRLAVIQPLTHESHPWPSLLFGFLSVSVWYNVLNQFMIQRVLGARDQYHARMGIVLAGFMKVLMPAIVVVPGLILFAIDPSTLLILPFNEAKSQADRTYIVLLQQLVPIGLRGLLLAALFGAIQSTVNSVVNSTATVLTLDIYQRHVNPRAGQRRVVVVGMIASAAVTLLAIALAPAIQKLGKGLFVYVQELYAFFAPPFAAIFLLGILFRRINAAGATTAVFAGFVLGIGMKLFVAHSDAAPWLAPYAMQAIFNWCFCVVVCVVVSLLTAPPPAERTTDQLTINWRRLNILGGLGTNIFNSVVTWWLLFVAMILALVVIFSGAFF